MDHVNQASNPWIVEFDKQTNNGKRLFCFSHAGGGAVGYRAWVEHISASVCAIRLPGRETRLRETHLTDWAALIPPIVAHLPLDQPFAFFGHSLGAIVAFEVARALQEQGLPSPEALFVSARGAPDVVPPMEPISHLTDAELTEAIQARYGGIPDILLQRPELLKLFLPTMRADFALVSNYRFQPAPLLNCPIVAFSGLDDALIIEDQLLAWGAHSSAEFNHHLFPGGHFYLEAQREPLLQMLNRYLK